MRTFLSLLAALTLPGCDLIDGEPFPGGDGAGGGASGCPAGLRAASGSFFVTNAQLDSLALQINPADGATRSAICIDDARQVANIALSVSNQPAGTLRLTFNRTGIHDLAADADASVELDLTVDDEPTLWSPASFLSGTIDVRSTSPTVNIFGNQLYAETPDARRIFFNFTMDATPSGRLSEGEGEDASEGGEEGAGMQAEE